jgi:hypothetical protein
MCNGGSLSERVYIYHISRIQLLSFFFALSWEAAWYVFQFVLDQNYPVTILKMNLLEEHFFYQV